MIVSGASTNLRALSIEVVQSLLSDFSLDGTVQTLEKKDKDDQTIRFSAGMALLSRSF